MFLFIQSKHLHACSVTEIKQQAWRWNCFKPSQGSTLEKEERNAVFSWQQEYLWIHKNTS